MAVDGPISIAQVKNLYCDDEEVVPIYRVVKDDELTDIQNTGIFKPSPFGSEGKYFSETADGAAFYGQQAYTRYPHEGPYTLLESSIPKELLMAIEKIETDRGISTYVIPNDLLPYLNSPVVRDSLPVPPPK
jgi:hypothetical protein